MDRISEIARRPGVVAGLAATLVAMAGAAATEIGPWYFSLRKPSWKPPDVAFGPIWTTIFACTATAGAMAWRREAAPKRRRGLVWLFGGNGVLNIAWSLLFFTAKRPDWALAESVALWGSVAAMIARVYPLSRTAAGLLSPYIVWVSLAVAMNAEIVRMNGPFDRR